MKDTLFIVVSRKGIVRTNKTLPQLARGERAISVEVSVPDSAFADIVPKARLEIKDDNLIRPVVDFEVTADSIEGGITGR